MAAPLRQPRWGRARTVRPSAWWADVVLLAGIAAVLAVIHHVGAQWSGELRPVVAIDPSLTALPRYALLSLARGLVAYALSLAFTLVYGYWAAHDKVSERVLMPLLDVRPRVAVARLRNAAGIVGAGLPIASHEMMRGACHSYSEPQMSRAIRNRGTTIDTSDPATPLLTDLALDDLD